MLFSVIIPVYKVEKYLTECVDSVLRQTCQDYEIILVDDGSPDGCPEICDDYAKKNENISVIHKENGGLSDARNTGLRQAAGDYIIFLDSDDYWDDCNFLKKAKAFLNSNKNESIDVMLFQAKKLFEASDQIVPDTFYDMEAINSSSMDDTVKYLIVSGTYSMSACTKILRKSTLIEKEITFSKGLLGEDLDWFLTVITNVENIHAIDSVNYVYRIRSGSITQTIGKKNLADCVWMLNKWTKKLQDSKIDMDYIKYYYSILSYAYVVALLNYQRLLQKDKPEIKAELKKYCYLLQYAVNNRIKLTQICYKLLGFEITSRLLSFYYRHK